MIKFIDLYHPNTSKITTGKIISSSRLLYGWLDFFPYDTWFIMQQVGTLTDFLNEISQPLPTAIVFGINSIDPLFVIDCNYLRLFRPINNDGNSHVRFTASIDNF